MFFKDDNYFLTQLFISDFHVLSVRARERTTKPIILKQEAFLCKNVFKNVGGVKWREKKAEGEIWIQLFHFQLQQKSIFKAKKKEEKISRKKKFLADFFRQNNNSSNYLHPPFKVFLTLNTFLFTVSVCFSLTCSKFFGQ